jgi:hypothetical protein
MKRARVQLTKAQATMSDRLALPRVKVMNSMNAARSLTSIHLRTTLLVTTFSTQATFGTTLGIKSLANCLVISSWTPFGWNTPGWKAYRCRGRAMVISLFLLVDNDFDLLV